MQKYISFYIVNTISVIREKNCASLILYNKRKVLVICIGLFLKLKVLKISK